MFQPQRAAGGSRIERPHDADQDRHGQAIANPDADAPCDPQRIGQSTTAPQNSPLSTIRLDRRIAQRRSSRLSA